MQIESSHLLFPLEALEIQCPKGEKFTDSQIQGVINLCASNHTSLLFVESHSLTEKQIELLTVAANNECKGLALKNPSDPNKRFGNFVTDLSHYYQDKKDSYKEGIRETLVQAREFYYNRYGYYPKTIMDFGCGEGHDILAYLRTYSDRPTFLAVDSWKPGLEELKVKLKELELESTPMRYVSQAFMKTSLEPVDLVSGSYAFPYRPPEVFDAFWEKITSGTNMICGHFFGTPEGGAKPEMTYHDSEEKVRALCENRGFKVLWLKEDHDVKTHGDNDGGCEFGKLFHVVAVKS